MNRKQFVLLLVLLVVLGGAGLFVNKSRKAEASSGEAGIGQKLLGDKFDVNDVVRITIKGGTNELNLLKTDLWRVRERNDYPANYSEVSGFLIKAAGLKIIQSEQVGASQLPRLQLAPPGQGTNSGILVEFKGKEDKTIQALTLGKPHMRKAPQQSQFGEGEGFPDGRYVMRPGNSKDILLIEDPLNTVEPNAGPWLNKDFFKVERPKAFSVTYPVATNCWRLLRDTETGEWKLAEPKPGETLDTNKLSSVTSAFASPSFNDVVSTNTKPEEIGLDKPRIVTIETFDDFAYTLKLGQKSGDEYPLTINVVANFPKERIPAKDEKPEDKDKADKAWKDRQKQLETSLQQAKKFENRVFLVPSWNVDALLKDRKELLVEKKEEPKTVESTEPVVPALEKK